MREIKFRAWNKSSKKMREVHSIHLGTQKVIVSYSGGGNYSIKFNEIELMQYTGLKDKNGKEIYEGDIVKDENGETFEVEWQPFSGAWNLSGEKYHFLFVMRYMDTFKVIGNIYENPNLLNDR